MTDTTPRPILSAVRAMHAAEDAGRDPYDTARVRMLQVTTLRQRIEAEGILACYETDLAVVEPAPGFLTRRQAG